MEVPTGVWVGVVFYNIPDQAILDLSFTVTGSAANDGTYDLSDYASVVFQTNGGTLDLSRELIGQTTNDEPWGTAAFGAAGDFNLFANQGGDQRIPDSYTGLGGGGAIPNGCWFFTLCTSNDSMLLVSFGPSLPPAPVPFTQPWSLGLVLMGMLTLVWMRRRTQA